MNFIFLNCVVFCFTSADRVGVMRMNFPTLDLLHAVSSRNESCFKAGKI